MCLAEIVCCWFYVSLSLSFFFCLSILSFPLFIPLSLPREAFFLLFASCSRHFALPSWSLFRERVCRIHRTKGILCIHIINTHTQGEREIEKNGALIIMSLSVSKKFHVAVCYTTVMCVLYISNWCGMISRCDHTYYPRAIDFQTIESNQSCQSSRYKIMKCVRVCLNGSTHLEFFFF